MHKNPLLKATSHMPVTNPLPPGLPHQLSMGHMGPTLFPQPLWTTTLPRERTHTACVSADRAGGLADLAAEKGTHPATCPRPKGV